ncbi:MAG: hypothetical protein ACE5NM_13675 [Sedimentisphaerales bacterium]
MKKPKDILYKAVEALAKTEIPPGPPQELVDATVTKLTKTSADLQEKIDKIESFDKMRFAKRLIKFAAAVLLVLSTGYTIGRLSARRPNMEQLYAALEPAIRRKVLEVMQRYWQVALASNYAQLKDELTQQYRRDLSEFAIQTLAASNAVTNQRLEQLIESINTAQIQDRRWVARALEQIELNRLRDKTQLSNGLESLAIHTVDELTRTKEDMLELLSYTQPRSLVPNEFRNSNKTNERSKQ